LIRRLPRAISFSPEEVYVELERQEGDTLLAWVRDRRDTLVAPLTQDIQALVGDIGAIRQERPVFAGLSEMELNGALSNPLLTEKRLQIDRLLRLKAELLGLGRLVSGPDSNLSRRRQGAVLAMVTRVLQGRGEMSVREIHAAVEHSLDERIPLTTVRDALSAHSRGSARRFRRIRRGVYVLDPSDR
jgi:hypothetical protein